jgi:hypothetical protein
MKLIHLVEKLIRVPEELKNKVVGEVLSCYYSFYLGYLGQERHKEIEAAASKYAQYKIHDVIPAFVQKGKSGVYSKRITYSDASVDSRYKSKKSKPKSIMLVVDFSGEEYSDAMVLSGKYMSHKLLVNLDGFITPQSKSAAKRSIESINDTVSELIHTVSHELQHVVQFDYLGHKNPKMGNDVSTTGIEDFADYAAHPIEFSPLIDSTIGILKRIIISHNRQSDKPLSKADIAELIKAFTNPEYKTDLKLFFRGSLVPASDSYIKEIPSRFFNDLYYKDKQLWKKAVKDFYHGFGGFSG